VKLGDKQQLEISKRVGEGQRDKRFGLLSQVKEFNLHSEL
jgi:hypothetical protein